MSHRDISPEPPLRDGRRRHIVILALDTLGDLVLRQPLFTGLLDDGHRVTVVVRAGYDEIISHLDSRLGVAVTEVNPHRSPDAETWSGLEALTRHVKKLDPEMIVSDVFDRTYADEWLVQQFPQCERIGLVDPDLRESPLETLPPSATRPPERSGPVPLTRGVACERNKHEADKHCHLFEALTGRQLAHCDPVIVLAEDVRARALETAQALDLQPGTFAAGCPAGTANVPLKIWPADNFIALAAHLGARHGLPVLLIGSTDEEDHLNEVSRIAATRGIRMPIWTGGPGDLGLLLGLLSLSRVYVGNDTGPMHFAAAVGTPVVARFGGGHWPRFLPRARRAFSATQQLPCFGCAWGCWLDDAACMKFVDHETWIKGVDWVLSGTTAERRIDVGRPLDERLTAAVVSGINARRRLKNALEKSDTDRAARLEQIHELTRRLAESDADQAARLEQIHELTRRLAESDADRAARLEQIHELTRMVNELQAERAKT